jgi:cyclophilin family peptidyl-prolyl cis-trans isomerase
MSRAKATRTDVRSVRPRRQRARLAAGIIVFGLVAAACGGTDDEVVADQSEEVEQTPESTDADSGEPATESPPVAAGLPPIDANCEALPDTDESTQSYDAPPPMCLEEGAVYTASVATSAGTITIDLDQTVAPTTVNSFVFLARNNYFDNTVCHRIIQEFVVQCGDPTATGTGGPGYTFPDELPGQGQYEVGSIAMANSGPNTNGSQFFIITGDSGAGLPPLYSLFGQVPSADLDVVSQMNAQGSLDPSGVPSTELRILSVEITQS